MYRYQGEITRQFKLIKEPYNTDLSYCGIEFLDDCVLYRPNLKVNGWSLATVISGGYENPGTVLILPEKIYYKINEMGKIIKFLSNHISNPDTVHKFERFIENMY